MQLDTALIEAFHREGFEVGVETNGTLPAPEGIDWLCVSPKANAPVVIEACDELKLVYPQPLAMPERFLGIRASHYFLSPMASPSIPETAVDEIKQSNTRRALGAAARSTCAFGITPTRAIRARDRCCGRSTSSTR